MKKRAIVVMVCAIGFVASFVIIGYFGLTSTGMMDRMYVSQRKQLVIGKGENLWIKEKFLFCFHILGILFL